jgi:hypothetical protein
MNGTYNQNLRMWIWKLKFEEWWNEHDGEQLYSLFIFDSNQLIWIASRIWVKYLKGGWIKSASTLSRLTQLNTIIFLNCLAHSHSELIVISSLASRLWYDSSLSFPPLLLKLSTKKNAESKITQQNLVTVLPSHQYGYDYGFFCGSVAMRGNHDN